jgi:tripartite-type tricarboxylate transporter receptor subunit TctC
MGYATKGALTAAALLLGTALSPAARAADFYSGKTMTLIVAFAPGGTADSDGRMIAQHLARHIPGKPHIVVQNMPGAGGIKAINMAYQIAKPDGLSIYQLASAHFLQQLAGSDAVKFDLSKMPMLGAWLHSTYVLSVRADAFTSIEDIRNSKKLPQIGTQGLGTGTYIYTVAWQQALGIKFKLVTGYEGNQQTLAVERGEIDGRTDTASAIRQRSPEWMKLAPPLVQNGPERDPLLPDVPTVNELNPNPGVFWDTINNALSMDRPYVLPPGTPAERVAELRQAWAKMLKDKDFEGDAAKRRWTIVPTSYDKVEAFYQKAARETPPDVIKELKELFP